MRNADLSFSCATDALGNCDDPGVQVTRAYLNTQRGTSKFPVIELEARRKSRAFVYVGTDALPLELVLQRVRGSQYAAKLLVSSDRHDDYLIGSESGRQDEALIVAVGHDDGADYAG